MKKKFLSLMIAAAMTVTAVGCGAQASDTSSTAQTQEQVDTNSDAQASSETDSSAAEASQEADTASTQADTADAQQTDSFPVTIEHVYGETVIEKQPERIATIAFGNQDVVLALGVVPVGFSAANYGVQDDSGMLPWTAEKLAELGEENPNVFQDTDGIDYEAVADSQPDVILAPYSGLTQEEYDMLSEIAPVVAYPETAWTISTEDWISITAKAIGKSKEGEELIASMKNTIEEKKAEHPEFEGKSFVWITFDEKDLSSLHAYSPEDTRCKFLTELGFAYPESVSQYIKDGSYSLDISTENADLLYDADFLIGYSTDAAYQAAAQDAVLGSIPALANNAVVSIESGTPLSAALTITPLSFEYEIDEYTDKLAQAIANANQ